LTPRQWNFPTEKAGHLVKDRVAVQKVNLFLEPAGLLQVVLGLRLEFPGVLLPKNFSRLTMKQGAPFEFLKVGHRDTSTPSIKA
jgi:hypothetical protein